MKRPIRAVIAAMPLVLALAACGSGGAPTANGGSNGGGSGPAQSGGSATVLVVAGGLSTWPNLDPVAAGTANGDYRNAIFGELFHQGKDGSITGDLAQSYQVSKDGLTVTIVPRPGVTFSDGTPLDADAIVTNIKRDLDPANACSCGVTFSTVTGVSKSGDDVVLKLSAPKAAIMAAFVNTALNWMASPTALQKEGTSFGTNPVGAGPFVVKSNDPSQKLVLSRNPTYYVQGQPYLDTLTFQSVGTDQSAYAALQSGSAQLVEGITTQQLLDQAKSQFNVVPIPVTSIYQTTFNTTAPPLNNPVAREALAYATDAAALDKGIFNSEAKLAQAPVGSGAAFYEASVPGYKAYDLAKAKQLVQQLGGLTVSIMGSPSNVGNQLMQALQAMWAQAGIKVSNITQAALPQLTANYASGNWNVAVGFSGAADPSLNLGLTTFFGSKGPDSGVRDPDLDALIAKASAELDPTARQKDYDQIYQLLSDKTYANFLFENATFNVAAKSGIQGYDQGARWIQWNKVSSK